MAYSLGFNRGFFRLHLIFLINFLFLRYSQVGLDKYPEYKPDKYDSALLAAKVILFLRNITYA